MKKLFTLVAMTVLTLSSWAKPALVGHRGSLWGLENSVESFTNGALKGYQYLETDWKLTGDNQFVCSHDDDTKRLGGTKTLATSTLEELQSEELAQTRSGVKYTGRLCSAQEYLDVCRKYNVIPLIELKWTTGINSNDQSNIPKLIEFIEKNGFRNNCIILTSMKPCLEYIRTNYPDIKLQFLTGQYWPNHFDWCVKWNMDVDIQTGYFDKSTIDKFHEAGLKVNIWTANTNDNYLSYGNMGVDMITTDSLDPATLPALDPTASFTPNYIDYSATTGGDPRGWFANNLEKTLPWPESIPAADVVKALMAGGRWFVAYNQGEKGAVAVVDPTTGAVEHTLAVPSAIVDFGATVDGKVYALASPGIVYGDPATGEVGEMILESRRLAIAVSGRSNDALVYTLGSNGVLYRTEFNANSYIDNSTMKWPEQLAPLDKVSLSVTTTTRDHILASVKDLGTAEVYWDVDNGALTPGSILAYDGLQGYGRYGKNPFGLRLTRLVTGDHAAVMSDYTFGHGESHVISVPMVVAGSETASMAAAGAWEDKVYVLAVGSGLTTYAYAPDVKEEAQEIKPKLERLWIMSNTTGNHPGNIDGTNAQQGTGVGGRIYVNNCDEKLIHVFDKTGHIGTIPGGAGWGCARDDAGNIIVRDDKLTGTSHSLLIYPAGVTPDNYSDPVKVTADVYYAGQTNFINASGDVLGDGGYIYLYPNKQTAANILRLEHGAVVSSFRSADLKMTGSTAGYIVPIDNNSQNWLYQIRNTAIHEYRQGSSVDFSTLRSATTAPKRNSTGGCAVFNLLGNKITIVNSGGNYLGGFSVKQGEADNGTLIATVDPIGNMGYTTGGNYSTFNWVIPEKQEDGSYYIYQYCPANGIAMYHLYDENTQGVDNIASDDVKNAVIVRDGDVLTASAPITVYSVTGAVVARSRDFSLDISNLLPGVYTARAARAVLKFVK